MKRSLADILIENSKVTKKVDGELTRPSVDNIHTPDNHTGGKKSRTVDGKRGLGDRKSSKVAQVTPPSKGEKRKMHEDAARLASKGTPSREGDGRTPAGKRSVPGELKNGKGNQKNRDEGIAKRKRMASPTVPSRSLEEGLGDNPDSKASMPFSKARNKDEGMKKPAVAKGKGVARGARIGSVGDAKKNPANIGKTRKMDKKYIGGVSAPVAKIKEGLEDLADFLGTDLRINSSVIESNYPDGMDHSYLDDDGSDAAYEEANDNMKYEVKDFLKNEGAGYIADYQRYVNDPKGQEDPTWFMENLEGMVEAAYDVATAAVQTEGFDIEVDEDSLKPILVEYMKSQSIPEEHIKGAFSNYMSEGRVAEDSLDSDGYDNTLSDAQYLMKEKGFNVAGGGMTGGQMLFKNAEGTLATINVHSFRPDEVVGWMVKGNGQKQEGKNIQQLNAYLNRSTKKPGLLKRIRNKVVGEDVGRKYTKSGMGKTGRQVVIAFLDQKPADNSKLHTDGVTLDILGMGGNRVAWWENGQIYFRNTSGRADQALQKTIKKMAAPNDIASLDDNRRALGMGEMSSGGGMGSGAIASGNTGGNKSALFASDEEVTEVMFFHDEDGILAVFPNEPADRRGNVTCYAHVGQHSACAPDYYKSLQPASQKEAAPLKSELEQMGYNLAVMGQKANESRYGRWSRK